MLAMGYDPKAKVAEMQKSAGPKYGISFLASILSAFILGKIIYHLAINTSLYGMKSRVRGLARLCDDRSVNG
jgi:hypothetical protein